MTNGACWVFAVGSGNKRCICCLLATSPAVAAAFSSSPQLGRTSAVSITIPDKTIDLMHDDIAKRAGRLIANIALFRVCAILALGMDSAELEARRYQERA